MTRFTLNDWRPRELQVHPMVQASLNRDLFRLPHSQWAREVSLGDGVRLDLVAVVHKDSTGVMPPGVHGIEVKMPDDTDYARRSKQLDASLAHCDYTWLVLVQPDFFEKMPDETLKFGVMCYNIEKDDVAHQFMAPRRAVNTRPVLRAIRAQLQTSLDRLYGVVGVKAPEQPVRGESVEQPAS